jgi:hypothetical protein
MLANWLRIRGLEVRVLPGARYRGITPGVSGWLAGLSDDIREVWERRIARHGEA